MVTTHRVLYYIGDEGLEIPLFYIENIEKLGGFMKKDGVKLHLGKLNQLAPYVIEYIKKVEKSNQFPQPPRFP